MKIPDFEMELQEIDPGLAIIDNPNRPGIANIMLNGKDVCPIPSGDIAETPEESRTIALPNGAIIRHRTRPEAIEYVKFTLEQLKDKDKHDAFYGIGEYA